VILNRGQGTVVDFPEFEQKTFEERITAYPKVLLRFGAEA
jgi:hypothetical protein